MECLEGKDFVVRVRYNNLYRQLSSEPRLDVLLIALPLSFVVANSDLPSAWPVVPPFSDELKEQATSPPPASGSTASPGVKPGSLEELSSIYRDASSWFLTRQYDLAFAVLEPVLALPAFESDIRPPAAAVVKHAPKSLRLKIWCLYITLVHVIVTKRLRDCESIVDELEYGRLYRKIQAGTMWSEVVSVGYDGIEEDVDIEVVISLGTLFMYHEHQMTYVEGYLGRYWSALVTRISERENSGRMAGSIAGDTASERSSSSSHIVIFEPGELSCIHLLLELYTLRVLYPNGKGELAKRLILANDFMDDKTRANFLKVFQSLEDAAAKSKQEAGKKAEEQTEQQSAASQDGSEESEALSVLELGQIPHPRAAIEREILRGRELLRRKSKLQKEKDNAWANPMKLGFMRAFRRYSLVLAARFRSNPAGLLRAVLFLFGILFALSKAKIRERVRNVTALGWDKVKGTVAMGVKVSQA